MVNEPDRNIHTPARAFIRRLFLKAREGMDGFTICQDTLMRRTRTEAVSPACGSGFKAKFINPL